MKNYIIYVLLIGLTLILLLGTFFIFFWKGEYYDYSNGIVGFNQANNSIIVRTHLFYPGYIYSDYGYEVRDGEIFFWLYKKHRFSGSQESLTNISLSEIPKGSYKIYYKNKNGQLFYIQDINFH